MLNSCIWAEKWHVSVELVVDQDLCGRRIGSGFCGWEEKIIKAVISHLSSTLLNLYYCLGQILWYSKWVNSVQTRFKTELFMTLDREKFPCLIANTFPTVKMLKKAVIAVVGKKAGRILGPWGFFPFVQCSGFICVRLKRCFPSMFIVESLCSLSAVTPDM